MGSGPRGLERRAGRLRPVRVLLGRLAPVKELPQRARPEIAAPWTFSLCSANAARPGRDSSAPSGQSAGTPFQVRPDHELEGTHLLQVLVRDNNVDQALKALKKKMQREGIFREMKLRGHYEKPSEKKARERAEAIRRARKLARKKMQREGLLPGKPKPTPGGPGGRPGAGGPGARPGGFGGGGGGGFSRGPRLRPQGRVLRRGVLPPAA